MSKIEFRISDEKKTKLKSYCTEHEITISKLLMNYIDTLLSKPGNAGKSPASKKNSVKKTALIKLYHCPYCGKDITSLIPIDRLNHLQNCKKGHNS
jgi:hypothetical protein